MRAARQGSWWSRAWAAIALAAFAVHLGAAVYEAALIAPLWSLTPPESVTKWMSGTHPDSSSLFHPLTAVVAVASGMAWVFGLRSRGWRRWWLTLTLAAAGALAAVTVQVMLPCERALLDAVARNDTASIVALTGEWMRAAAMRLACLAAGTWLAYRAQLASMVPARVAAQLAAAAVDDDDELVLENTASRDFAFGDEDDEPDIILGDEAPVAKQRWRESLTKRRRTAKK